MSEKRKYRTFTPEQKAEIVLAGLRGDRTVREICREHEIAETLCYQWRDRLLEGGKAALATPRDKGSDPRDAELNRGSFRPTSRGWGGGRRPTASDPSPGCRLSAERVPDAVFSTVSGRPPPR